jgi:uncharacterized membrane protein YhaH (DUF805 family)
MEAVMIESIKGTLGKYADFSGTATRKEFWSFYLFYIVAMFVSGFIGGLLGISAISDTVLIVLLIPLIACGARRNHDVGKSGWFMLVPFYNLALALTPSKPSNQA